MHIKKLSFTTGAFMSPNISVIYNNGTVLFTYSSFGSSSKRYDVQPYEKNIEISEKDVLTFLSLLKEIQIEEWEKNTYRNDDILDGMSWGIDIDISVSNNEKEMFLKVKSEGYEVYPNGYDTFIAALEMLIHESIYSRTYNRDLLAIFMKDKTKGEEARRKLFKKVSPMILEIVEGDINIDTLDYDVKEILYHYFNLLRIFGVSDADKSIMKYYILACGSKKNEAGIEMLEFIDPSMKEVYEHECRRLLVEADIWYLDKEAQEDIDILFTQTRMTLMYLNQRNLCCEGYSRHDDLSMKSLSLELSEITRNLKKDTDENTITHESYNPKTKAWLTGSVAQYLEHIEEEARKIKEICCCIRQYDYTLLKDEAVHDVALVLANKIFDEVLKFIDRLHVVFHGAELITNKLTIQDGDIVDLVEMISKNHDLSDILPLIEVFGESSVEK